MCCTVPAQGPSVAPNAVNTPSHSPSLRSLYQGSCILALPSAVRATKWVQQAINMLLEIKYTPVCGTGPDDPVCGLLEFDGCRLLLDCGWTEKCSSSDVEAILGVLPSVDAILLSHGDMAHMGALPALCALGALPPDLPIISTLPVKVMGCLMLQEFLADRKACSDQLPFSPTHVTQVCDGHQWALLRFYQRLSLAGRAEGVHVTPMAAGHTLGGAVWRLVSHDGQEVVYAVDWCHRKERHLAACLLPELFVRPAAMIMDARAALHQSLDSSRRDAEFLDLLLSTLRGTDGCVLIPIQTTARMLELALLLDEFWTQSKFNRVYPLVLVSAVGKAVIEAAQSQLEWMSDSVTKAFERKRENPFGFKCLKVLSNVSQLTQLQAGPKVVLAGGCSCEQGPARQLLIDWVGQEQHTICFVQRPQEGSLASTLLRHVPTAGGPPLMLSLSHTRRVPLEGAELEAWLASRKKEEEAEEEEEEEGQAAHLVLPSATRVSSGPLPSAGVSTKLDRSHSGASVVPGLTPLRSNSTHLSSLVRDASGNLVQQLLPSSSMSASQGALGLRLPSATPSDLGPGVQAATGRAAVLLDGFEPPQGACYPMFPDEDDQAGLTDKWDEYGRLPDLDAFKTAAAAMSTIGVTSQPLQGMSGLKRPGKGPGIKMEEEEESKEDVEEIMTRRRVRVKVEVGQADSEEEEEEEEEAGAGRKANATKLVEEQVEMAVKAAVRYFNYDGLADARIVRKAISEIAPQSLILLQGSDVARQDLQAHVSRDLQGFGTRVMLPGAGEQVDASVPACHVVQLSDVLQSECIPHQLGRSGDQGLVVDTLVCASAEQQLGAALQLQPSRSSVHHSEGGHADARSDTDMPSHSSAGGHHSWLGDVFFADGSEGVRLSEIKKALADAGIQSTWLGPGALSCGSVIISKISMYASTDSAGGMALGGEAESRAGRGHVVLEGALSEQHDDLLQRVRAVIYTQFGA